MINFRDIVVSEKSALQYLERICKIIGGHACPRCGSGKIYEIENGHRSRCPECGFRFTLYSGRWLDMAHISPKSWLWIIKLFEMELTATRICAETETSYPTTLKAVTAIRRSISAASANRRSGALCLEENRQPPVFYTVEDEGIETTAVLPANRIKILERLELGHLICTDKDIRYASLLCDGMRHGPVDFVRGFPRFRTYLAHPIGARLFITERLRKYHGVKEKALPLYVLEMEFRYNNRGNQLYELLVENICRFVPCNYRDAANMTPASAK